MCGTGIPQPYDRHRGIPVLERENAHRCRVEQQALAKGHLLADPSGRERSPKVSMRENRNHSPKAPESPDHAVGSLGYLPRGLPARAAVAKQSPLRPPCYYLSCAKPLEVPVVPFGQVWIGLGPRCEAGQLAGPHSPLQWARESAPNS